MNVRLRSRLHTKHRRSRFPWLWCVFGSLNCRQLWFTCLTQACVSHPVSNTLKRADPLWKKHLVMLPKGFPSGPTLSSHSTQNKHALEGLHGEEWWCNSGGNVMWKPVPAERDRAAEAGDKAVRPPPPYVRRCGVSRETAALLTRVIRWYRFKMKASLWLHTGRLTAYKRCCCRSIVWSAAEQRPHWLKRI